MRIAAICPCLLAGACFAASRVYDDPAPGGENGYAVTVDGVRAVVSDVRNSAMPVNIRWPGHQRDLDQTEIGGLVRFAFDGMAQVEVTAPGDFREVKIRPLARGHQARRKGAHGRVRADAPRRLFRRVRRHPLQSARAG